MSRDDPIKVFLINVVTFKNNVKRMADFGLCLSIMAKTGRVDHRFFRLEGALRPPEGWFCRGSLFRFEEKKSWKTKR